MSAVCQFRYKVTQGISPIQSVGLCSSHPSKLSLIQGEYGTWLLPFRINKEKKNDWASPPQVNRKAVPHSLNMSEYSQAQRGEPV